MGQIKELRFRAIGETPISNDRDPVVAKMQGSGVDRQAMRERREVGERAMDSVVDRGMRCVVIRIVIV